MTVKCRKQRCDGSVVAKSLTQVCETIRVPWPENEAASKLKWIQPKFMLMMTGSASAVATLEIIGTKHMKQIGAREVGNGVGLAIFINKQGEIDSRFFPENARIVAVAQADGGEGRAFVEERLLMFTQLRDVLAAEDSAIVAQEHQDDGMSLPQRTETNFQTGVVR